MLLHKTLTVVLLIVASVYKINYHIIHSLDDCNEFKKCMVNSTIEYCFDNNKCICNACNIDYFNISSFLLYSNFVYFVLAITFVGIVFCGERQYFIEETNYHRLLKKLKLCIAFYLIYMLFNILSGFFFLILFMHKVKYTIGSFNANIPWVCNCLLLLLYISCGTAHNAQLRRAIKINYLMKQLKSVNNEDLESEECSICLETLETNTIITNCEHKFHATCIKQVIVTTNICPLCRSVIIN